MSPGDTKEVEFAFPKKQLMAVEFRVSGDLDADKLFHFSRTTNLPDEIIAPLQQEFIAQLESIAIREFVNGVLDAIDAPDPNMTLADITRIRESVKHQSEHITAKRAALRELFKGFHLDRDSTLGGRTVEIIRALIEFGEKLDALDEAIGRTDLELMNGAVQNLRQVQLAVLRVEDAVRTMTTST